MRHRLSVTHLVRVEEGLSGAAHLFLGKVACRAHVVTRVGRHLAVDGRGLRVLHQKHVDEVCNMSLTAFNCI